MISQLTDQRRDERSMSGHGRRGMRGVEEVPSVAHSIHSPHITAPEWSSIAGKIDHPLSTGGATHCSLLARFSKPVVYFSTSARRPNNPSFQTPWALESAAQLMPCTEASTGKPAGRGRGGGGRLVIISDLVLLGKPVRVA